jgi:molecular chaperone DnaJ
MTDYYKTLNLNKNSSLEEIKISYKQLAKQYHPDKGGSTEKFQEIQIAYETLSDENKRREYDNINNNDFIPGHVNGFPFNFFNFHQQPANNVVKKNTESYNCVITLKEAYFGIKKNFNIKRRYVCDKCNFACSNCNGTGFDKNNQRIQIGPFLHIQNQVCLSCNGSGLMRSLICVECNNSGFKLKEKNFDLFIPRGVESGKKYTYETWGEQATKKNEIPGDFIIIIVVENDPHFKRNNLNLIYETDISLKDSIIGRDIVIPFFDENIVFNTKKISIINPNKEYIISNKGLCNDIGQVGNLILKFRIVYPSRLLNENEIALLEKAFLSINDI